MAVECVLAQAPVRNARVEGMSVYTHSGEFSPRVVDVMIPGRNLSFQFVRKYRSGHRDHLGPLGRGWTFTYSRCLVRQGKDILYFDGQGRTHRFTWRKADKTFSSPLGFYSVIKSERGVLR